MSGFLLSASGVERPIFVIETGFLQEMKDRKESRRVVKGSGELFEKFESGV